MCPPEWKTIYNKLVVMKNNKGNRIYFPESNGLTYLYISNQTLAKLLLAIINWEETNLASYGWQKNINKFKLKMIINGTTSVTSLLCTYLATTQTEKICFI